MSPCCCVRGSGLNELAHHKDRDNIHTEAFPVGDYFPYEWWCIEAPVPTLMLFIIIFLGSYNQGVTLDKIRYSSESQLTPRVVLSN
jgi:hypothetical protein